MALMRRASGAPSDFFPGFADVEEIGSGSLATVYRAREVRTGRPVALKVLDARNASPEALEAFERRFAALAAVSSHPNIVTVYRWFQAADERPVLVLELCAGSITDRLRAGHGLPVIEAVAIGVKIAGGLETAHRAGILHGDVTPQKLLITGSGEPALADFGVATLQLSTQTSPAPVNFTTLHAAPELLEYGEISAATDVYGLASSLYQVIAGRAAFRAYDGESPASVILRVLRDPVQPLVRADVPAQLSDLLIGAMAKDSESRPSTAAEFAEQLTAVEVAQGWGHPPLPVRGTGSDGPASMHRPPPPAPEPPLPPVPEPLPPVPEPPPPPAPEPPLPPIPEPVPPEPEPPLPPSPEPSPRPPAPRPPGPHPPRPVPEPPLPPAPAPPVRPQPDPPQPQEPEPPLHPEPDRPLHPEPPLPPAPAPPVHPEPEPPLHPAPPPVRPESRPSAMWRPIEPLSAEPGPTADAPPPGGAGERPPPGPSADKPPRPAGDQPPEPPAADESGEHPMPARQIRRVAATWPSAPAHARADPGELRLDPMSLRRKVTLRSGAASLVADDTGLVLRKGLRRSEIAWAEIARFEPCSASPDSTKGWLVAVTGTGPVELPATRRTVGDLRYVLALLDAYRQRALILAAR